MRILARSPWMIPFAPVLLLVALITAGAMLLVGALAAAARLNPRRP